MKGNKFEIMNAKSGRYITYIIAKKLNWDWKDGLVIKKANCPCMNPSLISRIHKLTYSQISLTMVKLELNNPSDHSKCQHSHAHNYTKS